MKPVQSAEYQTFIENAEEIIKQKKNKNTNKNNKSSDNKSSASSASSGNKPTSFVNDLKDIIDDISVNQPSLSKSYFDKSDANRSKTANTNTKRSYKDLIKEAITNIQKSNSKTYYRDILNKQREGKGKSGYGI